MRVKQHPERRVLSRRKEDALSQGGKKRRTLHAYRRRRYYLIVGLLIEPESEAESSGTAPSNRNSTKREGKD